MTPSIDSSLTRRNDSNLIWKSSEISFRFSQEYRDIFQIFPRVPGRDFDALPSEEETVSFLRELGHTGEINSLNDVVVDQMHQPWRTFAALINRGAVPPKIAIKFKKSSPSKKDSDLVPVDEEPVTKGKRIKRYVDVTRGKGIEMLSEVALTKEAQMNEVRKKSLRDFYKLHPSGSGTAAEKPPRVDKITLHVTSKGTSDKLGVPNVTKDESTDSELESWGNDEDNSNDDNGSENKGKDEENKSDDDKTPFDSKKGSDSEQDSVGSELDSEYDQQEYDDDEVKDDDDDDKFEGDEHRGIESDDVQDKKANVEMTDAQQEKENLKITQEQVVEDAHVTITTAAKDTKVPDASESESFSLSEGVLSSSLLFSLSLPSFFESFSLFLSSSSFPQDSNSLSVDSSLVTSGTPSLSPITSLVIGGVILSTLGGFLAAVPEPLGCNL
nr:hypothetical protein [Tanacetum cinerariifolium]